MSREEIVGLLGAPAREVSRPAGYVDALCPLEVPGVGRVERCAIFKDGALVDLR